MIGLSDTSDPPNGRNSNDNTIHVHSFYKMLCLLQTTCGIELEQIVESKQDQILDW